MARQRTSKFRFLIKFPTRERPDCFFRTLDAYYKMRSGKFPMQFIITLDEDDHKMNNPAVRDRLDHYENLRFQFGHSRSKVHAVNRDIEDLSDFDILLLASDDMVPEVDNYDAIIAAKFREYFPDLDGVVHFNDGNQGERLNTFVIMGRPYFERFGYIYHPDYTSVYCDNEFTEVANLLKKQQYFDQVIIRHQHPAFRNTVRLDSLYMRNDRFFAADRRVLQRRRRLQFDVALARQSKTVRRTTPANTRPKRKALFIQPGRFGDIVICLPIAKELSKEYDLDWLCPIEYHSMFRSIDYCTPIAQRQHGYDRVIDLSFGFGGAPERWWQRNMKRFDSFVTAKYELAGFPLDIRWNLDWKRDNAREKALLKHIQQEYDKEYVLVHETTHLGQMIDLDLPNKVHFKPIGGYTIFDWYQVIENAQSVHCIDSSLCNFIEALVAFHDLPKYYYNTRKAPNQWDKTLLRNNWTTV